MELISGLTILGQLAKEVQGRARSAATFDALLHRVNEQSEGLSRVEKRLELLGQAGLLTGLAHLEDAASPHNTLAERERFLTDAREDFKRAAVTAPDPLVGTAAALLCARCHEVRARDADARHWAQRAVELADDGLDSILSEPAPAPAPARGLTERFENWLDNRHEVEQTRWWNVERYERIGLLVSLGDTARSYAASLSGLSPPPRRELRPRVDTVTATTSPWLLEPRAPREAFRMGEATVRLRSATLRPWWPDAREATIDVLLDVDLPGCLEHVSVYLTAADGCEAWAWDQDRPVTATARESFVHMRYAGSGRRGEPAVGFDDGVELVAPKGRVFFDVLGTPPRELALIAPIGGRQRGESVPFRWRKGKPYKSSPPPPEPTDESQEPERWFDDPRSDVIGWG